MDRRRFLQRSSMVAGSTLVLGCDELNTVLGTLTPTTVSLNRDILDQAVQTQRCEQWCWAASISMIFGFHGYNVAQEQIVAQTYGAVVCLPAYTTYTIGADLSRPYVDSAGRRFQSRVTRAYDAENGIFSLSNAHIVDELSANRPLLYCNRSHAMVLYSVSYYGPATNPNIVAASVVDPWPFSSRRHPLSSGELVAYNNGGQMMFLAAVSIT